jgi:hypothetical protein
MHAICAAQFAGSHMCTTGEYYRTGNTTPVPASGAWADASAYTGSTSYFAGIGLAARNGGRYTSSDSSYNCLQWTANTTYSGTVIFAAGPNVGQCSVARPVACCE